MSVLSYPVPGLSVVIVVGVLATIVVPLFAFIWLLLFLVMAVVAVVAAGWGLVAGFRAVGGPLWRRRLGLVRPGGKAQGDGKLSSSIEGSEIG